MAEQEPGFAKAVNPEAEELAKLQKKASEAQRAFDKANFQYEHNELFGKYDVTVPNEGEVNFQEYIDQRPAGDNDGFNHENGELRQSGKFASFDQYLDYKKGTAAQQFDARVEGLRDVNANVEIGAPNYEEMGLMQLAKEASKARTLGDPEAEREIREAAEHHLTGDVMGSSDDSESSEAAQARYEAELAHYDSLVEKFVARSNPAEQHATNSHTATSGEGQPSARTDETKGDESPAPETSSDTSTEASEPIEATAESQPETLDAGQAEQTESESETGAAVAAESDSSETAPNEEVPSETSTAEAELPASEVTPTEDDDREPGGYFNGKKITVARVVPHPSGDASQDALVVIDEDGNEKTIRASEVEYVKKSEPKDGVDQINEMIATAEAQSDTPEKEAKGWWAKVGDKVRKLGGAGYWAAGWASAHIAHPVRESWANWLNRDVTENMTEEEKEKSRKEQRVVAIVAGAGLAVIGATITGILIAKGLHSGDSSADLFGSGNGGNGGGESAPVVADRLDDGGASSEGVVNTPIVGGENLGGPEVIPDASEVSIPITVESGDGGESLFNRLGIDANKWYDNQWAIRDLSPDNFYVENGNVRINDRPLPQNVQDYINSLR